MTKKTQRFLVLSFLILLAGFLIAFSFSNSSEKYYSVTFVDVGQGHATFFQTPNKIKFLVDSGNGLEAKSAVAKNFNFFDRQLDICLATHFDLDHVGVFPYLVSNFNVSYFFDNGIEGEEDIFKLIDKKLAQNKISREKLTAGDVLQIDPETKIEVLFPPTSANINSFADNSSSLILKITHQNSSVLITGDSPSKMERFLIETYGEKLKSDILLAGHHGSKYSSATEFLEMVQPEYLIISAGEGNPYGHPNQEVLDRASSLNIKVLRTDELGNIKFIYKNGKLVLEN